MMFRRRILAPLLVSAAAFAAPSAHADPAAADIASAKHAFENAVSLENEQHWAEAAQKLREAIAVKDTPGLRYHLAHCETEQGHFVEAALEYDRASELLQKGAKAPDVQKLIGPASEAVKQRIAHIAVELPADLNAPSAAIDGKIYPPSELALGVPLNPGRHALRVTASGRSNFERALVLKEGEQASVRAELLPNAPPTPAPVVVPRVSAAPAPASVAPAREAKPSQTKLYLMIGESVLTVAGLAVGIGYQVAKTSASDRIDSAQARIDSEAPNDERACSSPELFAGACSDLQSAIDDHDRASLISSVGFVTAGVGAVALVTTWLAYPDSSHQTSGLQLQPTLGLGRVGLVGRF